MPTAQEMKAAINNATNATNETSDKKPEVNTYIPREKLSIQETIDFKSLLKLEFETNKTAIALQGSFESAGKTIEYGILPLVSVIPVEYVGKKPASSIYITSNGIVFGKVTSIGSDSLNYIPVSLKQVNLENLGTF